MTKRTMKEYKKTILHKRLFFLYLLIIVFFIFILMTPILAQNTVAGKTPGALSSGTPIGSFALSDFDSVNPYSGNLNFNLPLLRIESRGETGYQMSLKIEHKWNVSAVATSIPNTYDNVVTSAWWNPYINYSPGTMVIRRSGDGPLNSDNCNGRHQKTVTYFTFISQNGTETNFYDAQTNGTTLQQLCPQTNYSRGTVFYSVSGEGATFISDTTILDYNNGSSSETTGVNGYLKFKSGTIYRIDVGKVMWTQDRNGNKTSLTYDSNSRLIKVTDTLGREVTISPSSQVNPTYDEITYYGNNGNIRTIRVNYTFLSNALKSGSLQTIGNLFGSSFNFQNANTTSNPIVVSSVQLPDGRSYQFKYNSYADLSKVDMPTGGAIEYDFEGGIAGNTPDLVVYRRVSERRVYADGSNLTQKTAYTVNSSNNSVEEENTGSNGAVLSKEKHYYLGRSALESLTDFQEYFHTPWNDGLEYQTDMLDRDGVMILRRSVRSWTPQYNRSWGGENPQVTSADNILEPASANLINRTTYSYDQYGNTTDAYSYDFGNGQPGQFLKRNHTDYVTDTNYTSYTGSHLRNLPSQTWVSSDAAGDNKVSQTEFKYDETTLLPRANVVGWTNPNSLYRGNLTKTRRWLNQILGSGDWLETRAEYDTLGNVIKAIDAKNYISTIDYTDRFGAPDGEARGNIPPSQLNGQNTFAFPTAASNPLGWTAYTQFDYSTGQPVNTEDINGVISKTTYNDALDRPTQTVAAVGTTFEQQSNVVYDDANRRIESKSDLNALNDNVVKSESFYDGLGRTIESRRYESDGSYITTKSVPFVMMQDPVTSVWRAATKVSNPYRANEPVVWTTSLSDSLGRTIKVITPDGAIVKTDYNGNAATVTDQAGKQRRSITNALGQLKRVDEPDTSGNLGSLTAPTQPTLYDYDVLNNLTSVTQSGNNTAQCGANNASCLQTRSFAYDSLSKLKSATNPESGTISYGYDNNGNLTSKIDARTITTTYDYDALNRVVLRKYNDGITPAAAYTYDNVPNAKGKLTKVTNGTLSSGVIPNPFSVTEYQAFDTVGRVTQSQQWVDGTAYGTNPMTYKYNLSGALIEEKYPSGRVVKNVLDNDGDLAIVQSSKNVNSGYFDYAKSFTYTAAGAVSSMQLGNGKWESTQFNSRLQPEQIALGTTQNETDKLKLNFSYNSAGQNDNNGNVRSQTITVPTTGNIPGFTATLNYTYDSSNRLKSAIETIPGQTVWQQTFKYDRYGNRQFDTTVGNTVSYNGQLTDLSNCPATVCNPTPDAGNNRLNGYTYDAAGNMKIDAESRTFTYDAENKQTEVVKNNVSLGKYYYDGDGKRVKKIAYEMGQLETTIFVYDASGRMVAEYATNAASTTDAQVSYLTNDHLGSPRMTTDRDGTVYSRRDFMPFGEEVMRTGYGADKVRQKFTSYERDNETELDFAQARYHNSNLGRFQSPDRYSLRVLRSGGLNLRLFSVQPQNWNSYSYCRNNPMKYVDRDGEHPLVAAAIIGGLIGAVAGGGVEIAKQKFWDGKENIDWGKVGGATIQGGIFGAVAGLTGGAGLALPVGQQIAALITANVAGGAINRGVSGEQILNPIAIGIDAAAGAGAGYLAGIGQTRYFNSYAYQATEPSRVAQAEAVELLMISSPIPSIMPTMTSPVVQNAIRSSAYNGILEGAFVGSYRTTGKVATQGTLNFLFNFNFARTVHSANNDQQNLGVVTVHADGSEEYEGPLKKIK